MKLRDRSSTYKSWDDPPSELWEKNIFLEEKISLQREQPTKTQRFVSAKPEAKVDPLELVKEVPVQPHLQFHRVKR